MFFYCTCSTNKNMSKSVNNGRTPFREVVVDSEGICLDCGYYAVAYFDKIPNNGKLYELLIGDIPPYKHTNTKGGLTLKAIKESKRKKKGRISDQTRENRNGNLDV